MAALMAALIGTPRTHLENAKAETKDSFHVEEIG
jgi:hypothetical protein